MDKVIFPPAAEVLFWTVALAYVGIALLEYGRKNSFHVISLVVVGITTVIGVLGGLFFLGKLLAQ
jgi:hypothetical protein